MSFIPTITFVKNPSFKESIRFQGSTLLLPSINGIGNLGSLTLELLISHFQLYRHGCSGWLNSIWLSGMVSSGVFDGSDTLHGNMEGAFLWILVMDSPPLPFK